MAELPASLSFRPPWRDRRGQLVPIKAVTFAAVCLPALVLAGEAVTGSLGARPLNEAIHFMGLWTIRLLVITLAVTPARFAFDWPKIVLLRRMLGVATMTYALGHLSLYIVDQNFNLQTVVSEIVRRYYLTIGFAALLGLVALGATSTDGMIKRLGRKWKPLHRLIYVIAPLGLLHYYMQSKANVSSAVVLSGLFVWLMLWRLAPAAWRRAPLMLAALAVGATLITAGLEALWYGLATRISPERILLANLNVGYALRPAVWVGIITIATGIGITAWSRLRPRSPSGGVRVGAPIPAPSPPP